MNAFRKLGLMMGLSLSIMSMCSANAQEHQDNRHGRAVMKERKMKSPEERAQMKAEEMRRQLRLDDKTYKKVYKHYLKQYEYMQENMRPASPGKHGHMVAPVEEAHYQKRHEMVEGERRPERPQGEMHREHRRMEGQHHGRPMTEEMKNYLDRQDKELRKILSPEQYREWMATHPREYRPE